MNYTRYLSLNAQVVYVKLDPRYCGMLEQTCKHNGASIGSTRPQAPQVVKSPL